MNISKRLFINDSNRPVKQKAVLLLIGLVTLTATAVRAQVPDYPGRIAKINAAINSKLRDQPNGLYFETTDSAKNENKHSWLWPLCALIQGTNEMEALNPGNSYMQPVDQAIEQYYSDKPPYAGYQDYPLKERASSRFYDDNQWIAIAYLDAYKRNHQQKYLDASKTIYQFMLGGQDTVAGGGLYWKEGDMDTKNTCSNGPGALVALQLYQITKQPQYLKEALNIYTWTNKTLQAPNGLFYDNINVKTLKIGKAFYTYNTGSMLQANVLLYKATKNKKYLAEAKRIATAGRAYFFKNGRLPNEYWFNAVMLRGYQELYRVDKNPSWIDFFAQDAERIWNTEKDADNLLGTKPAKRLIDQGAMIEIYARLQELSGKKGK